MVGQSKRPMPSANLFPRLKDGICRWCKNLTDDEYAGVTTATSPVTDTGHYFLTLPRTYDATLRYEI